MTVCMLTILLAFLTNLMHAMPHVRNELYPFGMEEGLAEQDAASIPFIDFPHGSSLDKRRFRRIRAIRGGFDSGPYPFHNRGY
ncbi:hypothetical protein AAHC03_024537 [Spirometra sp. Aus1]